MTEEMNKAELLDAIRRERARWVDALAGIDRAKMTEPGAAGDWSIKDLIAHVTWSERQMVGVLEARALVGSDLWSLPQADRNAIVYAENKDRSLQDIMEEAGAVYQQLMILLEGLAEEELIDPTRFEGMPPEWVPWQLIAGNTYEHYRDHLEDVRAWHEKLDG